MRIAILGGTGQQGFGLSLRLALAGYEVIIGSRDLQKAEQRATDAQKKLLQLGQTGRIQGMGNLAAARAGELVILTVPYPSYRQLLPEVSEALRGKILIDASVPLISFQPPIVEVPAAGSATQEVQQLAGPSVTVVGAFKTNSAVALNHLDRPMESDVFVCADNSAARQRVIELTQSAGLRAYDAGSLKNAALLEQLTGLLIHLNQRYEKKDIGLRLTDT